MQLVKNPRTHKTLIFDTMFVITRGYPLDVIVFLGQKIAPKLTYDSTLNHDKLSLKHEQKLKSYNMNLNR